MLVVLSLLEFGKLAKGIICKTTIKNDKIEEEFIKNLSQYLILIPSVIFLILIYVDYKKYLILGFVVNIERKAVIDF